MSVPLFNRQVSLNVDGTDASLLRVVFKVTKTLEKEPNSAEITVYNLAESTRGAMSDKFASVILKAGYGKPGTLGTTATIFTGDARTIDHFRSGPDWTTKIQAGDGERAFQYDAANVSFGRVEHVLAIRALVNQSSLNPGNLEQALASSKFANRDAVFRRGFSARGPLISEVEKLMRSHGFRTSVQQGAFRFTPISPDNTDFSDPINQVPFISEKSGMVGGPQLGTPDKKEKKPSVVKVKVLLMPEVYCGGLVRVDAEHVRGTYLVQALTHSGDTMGGDWYTDLELVKV